MPPRRRCLAAVLLCLGLVAAACTGDEDAENTTSPEEVMAQVKQTLDETSGVRLRLATGELPSSVQGITEASGVAVHPAGFEGTITASVNGIPVEVEVIATDGKVWIKFLTPTYQEADPADYGAPDPARLMATEGGFSDLLVATEDLARGEQVRGGANNEEILTEYTGTVPGELATTVIPSASGDFDAAYTVTEDGELRRATLTGEFYPGAGSMTYTLDFDDYGLEQDISAP